METLQKKITTMEQEMVVYSDLGALKSSAEEKKEKLIELEKVLRRQKDATKKVCIRQKLFFMIQRIYSIKKSVHVGRGQLAL